MPCSSPACSNRAALSSSSARARAELTAQRARSRPGWRGRSRPPPRRRPRRTAAACPGTRSAGRARRPGAERDLGDVDRRRISRWATPRAAERLDALRHQLLRPRQIADDPVRDAERVDADRLLGGEPSRRASSSARSSRGIALSASSRASAHSPRNCSARHSACGSAELDARPRWLSSTQRHGRGRARRCGSRSPPPPAGPRRAAPSAPARRPELRRSRRFASCRSIRRIQIGHSATQKRSALARLARRSACRVPHVGSPPRGRAAASRAPLSASASAQRACRSSRAALSPASRAAPRVQAHRLEQAVAPLGPRSSAITSDFSTRRASTSAISDASSSSPAQTPSTASSSKPPANTPSRRKSIRSSGSSRSWLHCSVAAQRLLARRRRMAAACAAGGSDRRADPRSPQAPSAANRPAASSSASGRPSSRKQIRATSAAFSSSSAKPGRGRGRTLDEQRAPPRTRAVRSAGNPLLRIGDVERRDPEDDLARHAQRLAAGREHRQPGSRAQERRRRARAIAPSRCSQLSSTSSSERGAR